MKVTRYFREQVLRKRPYIRVEWCERILASPLATAVQADGRIRFWGIVPELDGRVLRVVTLENFLSLLKRGLRGTYVAVEPFHLFRYLDEQAFRFNNRLDASGKKLADSERFAQALSPIAGRRLTFAEVTGRVGETTAN